MYNQLPVIALVLWVISIAGIAGAIPSILLPWAKATVVFLSWVVFMEALLYVRNNRIYAAIISGVFVGALLVLAETVTQGVSK